MQMKQLMAFFGVCLMSVAAHGFQNAPPALPIVTRSAAILVVLAEAPKERGPFVIRDLCTVTIGASDLILTAGHCVSDSKGQDYPPSQLFIYFANIEPSDTLVQPLDRTKIVRVEKTKKHEHYAPDGGPDLAVVKLKRPVPAPFKPAPPVDASFIITDLNQIIAAGVGIGPTPGLSRENTCCTLTQMTPGLTRKARSYSAIDFSSPPGTAVAGGDSGGPAFVQQGSQLSTLGILKGEYPSSPEWLKYEDLRIHSKWLAQTALELGSRF
jgi:hypothetical protein